MTKTVHGIVRGNSIEITESIGIAEGQAVEVQITILEPAKVWGEGIIHSAGALANEPEWDAIMEEIHQNRKLERRNQFDE